MKKKPVKAVKIIRGWMFPEQLDGDRMLRGIWNKNYNLPHMIEVEIRPIKRKGRKN